MEPKLKEKICTIVDGKLPNEDIEKLARFLEDAISNGLDKDERFFKNLAYEMSGGMKDLALLIIDFRRDLKSKIDPAITELALKYIPQTTDQLEGIIETTEMAANKIMDNLEVLQEQTAAMVSVMASLKSGKLSLPGDSAFSGGTEIHSRASEALAPLTDYFETTFRDHTALLSDIFAQMSFQDLTGQRIRKIMNLVQQMEEKLKKTVVSFGIKLSEKEKNPDITQAELQQAVAEKVSVMAGPQKTGEGLDQAGIDEILAGI